MAKSPPGRTCIYSEAILDPNNRLFRLEGIRNSINPFSTTGFITITFPPRRRIFFSFVSNRGWFELGFAPIRKNKSQ